MSTIYGTVHNPEQTRHPCRATETEALVELLDPKNSGQRLYTTKVDQEGKYVLKGINAGSYLLFSAAWGTENRFYWEIPVKIGPDETIDIDLLADTAQVLK